MLLLWDLYWPVAVAAIVIGIVTGALAYRQGRPRARKFMMLAAGIAATLAVTALWHGPFGTAQVLRHQLESAAQATLAHYEMTQVRAELEGDPLVRTLILSGPADDFQRGELVRILGETPGVAAVRWSDQDRISGLELPLIAEVELWSLAAFGLGVLLAYLVELRRRARAEWRW